MAKKSLLFKILCVFLIATFFSSIAYSASDNDSYWQDLCLEYQEQIKNNTTDGKLYFFLGVAYAYLGELKLAVDAFDNFEKIDKNHAIRKSIIQDYQYAEEYTSNYTVETLRDWSILAFAYYLDYKYPQSIDMFNRLIKVEPANIWHYAYLAYVYCLNDRLDEGLAILDTALEIEPKNEYLKALRAAAYFEKGWTAKAAWELLKTPSIVNKIMELSR